MNLFSYLPSGGRHFLAYQADIVVSHAVVTTVGCNPPGFRSSKRLMAMLLRRCRPIKRRVTPVGAKHQFDIHKLSKK